MVRFFLETEKGGGEEFWWGLSRLALARGGEERKRERERESARIVRKKK